LGVEIENELIFLFYEPTKMRCFRLGAMCPKPNRGRSDERGVVVDVEEEAMLGKEINPPGARSFEGDEHVSCSGAGSCDEDCAHLFAQPVERCAKANDEIIVPIKVDLRRLQIERFEANDVDTSGSKSLGHCRATAEIQDGLRGYLLEESVDHWRSQGCVLIMHWVLHVHSPAIARLGREPASVVVTGLHL
jgi:hypothetical protein